MNILINQLFVVYLLDKWHIEKNKIIKFLYFLIILELLEATIMEKYVAKPPSSTPLENSATLCETKAKIPNGNNLIIQEITKYKTLCNASKTFVIASR